MKIEQIAAFSVSEYSAANLAAHAALEEFLSHEPPDMALLDFPHNFKWLDQENGIATCNAYWCADRVDDMEMCELLFVRDEDGSPVTTYPEESDGWLRKYYPTQHALWQAALARPAK